MTQDVSGPLVTNLLQEATCIDNNFRFVNKASLSRKVFDIDFPHALVAIPSHT